MIDTMLAVLAVLTLSSFSAPLVVEAQQAAKLFTVGELHPGTSSEERFAALREAGYVEGQNLVVVRRHAAGRIERLPALAAELVGLRPDVILATGTDAIGAAKNIIALAARHRLPAIYEWRESAEDGGLLAYGAKSRELNRRVAVFVDKILRGARPGDLPVEQPAAFELVINMKTAKALGLAIPPSLLARADHIVE